MTTITQMRPLCIGVVTADGVTILDADGATVTPVTPEVAVDESYMPTPEEVDAMFNPNVWDFAPDYFDIDDVDAGVDGFEEMPGYAERYGQF